MDQHANTWRDRAACLGLDTDMFFPHPSEDPSAALAVCAACPVREECLTDALKVEPSSKRYGIRGGLTAKARTREATVRRVSKCARCDVSLPSDAAANRVYCDSCQKDRIREQSRERSRRKRLNRAHREGTR